MWWGQHGDDVTSLRADNATRLATTMMEMVPIIWWNCYSNNLEMWFSGRYRNNAKALVSPDGERQISHLHQESHAV